MAGLRSCCCIVSQDNSSIYANKEKTQTPAFLFSYCFCSVLLLWSIDFSSVFAFSFFIALLFFGGFHVWLVFNDQTTIETSNRFRHFLSHGPSGKKAQYHRNWCNVMDTNPLIWMIPIHDKDFHFSWDFMEVRDSVG